MLNNCILIAAIGYLNLNFFNIDFIFFKNFTENDTFFYYMNWIAINFFFNVFDRKIIIVCKATYPLCMQWLVPSKNRLIHTCPHAKTYHFCFWKFEVCQRSGLYCFGWLICWPLNCFHWETVLPKMNIAELMA